MKNRALLLCGLFVLGGCKASISSHALPPSPVGGERLPAGFVYSLPAANMSAAPRLQLRSCDDPTALDPAARELAFAVVGEIMVEQVPGQQILLDPRSLSKAFKTMSLAPELHENGMLKSINASVEDESAAAAGALLRAAGAVALFATAPAAEVLTTQEKLARTSPDPTIRTFGLELEKLAKLQAPKVSSYQCKPETLELLGDLATSRAAVRARTVKLEQDNGEILQLILLRNGALDEAGRKEGKALAERVARTSAELDALRKKVAGIEGKLSMPLREVARDGQPTQQPEEEVFARYIAVEGDMDDFLERLFAEVQVVLLPNQSASTPERVRALLKIAGQATLSLTRATRGTDFGRQPRWPGYDVAKGTSKGVEPGKGIVYVMPATVKLSLTTVDEGKTKQVAATAARIPQLGQYVVLPLEAGFGEKVELAATFAPDGSLLTGRYSRPKSGGKAAFDLAETAANTGLSTQEKMLERQLKAKERAEKDDDRRLKLALEEQARADAVASALVEPPNAVQKAEEDRLKAEIAVLQARQALRLIEAALAAPLP
jgi:hypothetical protein